MKTGNIRDFIVEKDLEPELLDFVPKSVRQDVKEWLDSEDLSY